MTETPEQPRLFSAYPHVTYRVASFDTAGYGDPNEERISAPLTESNCMSSAISDGPHAGRHTVMLDIDLPAALIPSSTPGHHHLYVDVVTDFDKLEAFLKAAADIGMVEPGYAAASIERQHTALRLPWVHKHSPVEPAPLLTGDLPPF